MLIGDIQPGMPWLTHNWSQDAQRSALSDAGHTKGGAIFSGARRGFYDQGTGDPNLERKVRTSTPAVLQSHVNHSAPVALIQETTGIRTFRQHPLEFPIGFYVLPQPESGIPKTDSWVESLV